MYWSGEIKSKPQWRQDINAATVNRTTCVNEHSLIQLTQSLCTLGISMAVSTAPYYCRFLKDLNAWSAIP